PERASPLSPETSLRAYLCRCAVRAPPASLEAFLGSVKSGTPGRNAPCRHSLTLDGNGICLIPRLTAWTRTTNGALALSFCVPPLLKRRGGGTGISTCWPSSTPIGLDLGPD